MIYFSNFNHVFIYMLYLFFCLLKKREKKPQIFWVLFFYLVIKLSKISQNFQVGYYFCVQLSKDFQQRFLSNYYNTFHSLIDIANIALAKNGKSCIAMLGASKIRKQIKLRRKSEIFSRKESNQKLFALTKRNNHNQIVIILSIGVCHHIHTFLCYLFGFFSRKIWIMLK